MKVLLTGAHFTPAIAVIEELKKIQDISITYVGRNNTMESDSTKSVESQIMPKLGVKFIPIITGRVQRHFSIYTIWSLFKIPIGIVQSLFIILREKPDVTISFGGYVAVPVVVSSWLFSIPIIIHEQTLVSGLANKVSSLFARKILMGFPQDNKNPKMIFTGNPIRKEILKPENKLSEDFKNLFKEANAKRLPIIFITGGNQGSHLINITVEEILDKLTQIACVIHQTGDSKYQDYERLALKQSNRYLVKKWIGDEVGDVFANADLIVSRAGANTLTESAYWQIPTLAIPLPHLYQNEQIKNAKFFEQHGLVTILYQSDVNKESLYNSISGMLKDLTELKKRAKQSKQLTSQDAAKRIVVEILQLASKN